MSEIFDKNPEVRRRVLLNREIRQVPLDWQHPQNEDGSYIPLTEYTRLEDIWYSGRTEEEAREVYEEDKNAMMPDFSEIPQEKMGICAYENFTEGIPISPVFLNTPEGRFALAKYCSENASITDRVECLGVKEKKAGLVDWVNTLFGDELYALDIKSGRIDILAPSPPDLEQSK